MEQLSNGGRLGGGRKGAKWNGKLQKSVHLMTGGGVVLDGKAKKWLSIGRRWNGTRRNS